MSDPAPATAPVEGATPVAPAPVTSMTGSDAPTPVATETPATGEVTPPAADPKPADAEASFDPAKLTVPEGITVPAPMMEKLSGYAKEFGLPQKAVQDLFNLHVETLKESSSAGQTSFVKEQTDWQNEIRNDPQVGGPKLEANRQTIQRAITEYAAPGFVDFMNRGAGNNPAVFKTFLKMSQALTEGQPVRGAPPSRGPQGGGGFEGMADRMYPSMKG